MDTLRDKRDLEALWVEGRAPWNVWSASPSKEDSTNARLKAA
jgi:hypothetical protein